MIHKPKKTKVKISRQRVKRPARFEEIDTGAVREVEVTAKDGSTRTEERPIKTREVIPAQIETVQDEVARHEVVTERRGLVEKHQFADPALAHEFYKGGR